MENRMTRTTSVISASAVPATGYDKMNRIILFSAETLSFVFVLKSLFLVCFLLRPTWRYNSFVPQYVHCARRKVYLFPRFLVNSRTMKEHEGTGFVWKKVSSLGHLQMYCRYLDRHYKIPAYVICRAIFTSFWCNMERLSDALSSCIQDNQRVIRENYIIMILSPCPILKKIKNTPP